MPSGIRSFSTESTKKTIYNNFFFIVKKLVEIRKYVIQVHFKFMLSAVPVIMFVHYQLFFVHLAWPALDVFMGLLVIDYYGSLMLLLILGCIPGGNVIVFNMVGENVPFMSVLKKALGATIAVTVTPIIQAESFQQHSKWSALQDYWMHKDSHPEKSVVELNQYYEERFHKHYGDRQNDSVGNWLHRMAEIVFSKK